MDFLKIAKGIAGTVLKVAPKVVSALPIPGVVGTILGELGVALDGKTEDQVIAEVNAMPVEKLAVLKNHEQKMREFEVEEREQDLKNVVSARTDTKDIKFASPHFVLAALLVALFCAVCVGIIWFTSAMDPAVEKFVFYVLGVLSNETARVLNFFFGSSLGSKRKTDIMANGNG